MVSNLLHLSIFILHQTVIRLRRSYHPVTLKLTNVVNQLMNTNMGMESSNTLSRSNVLAPKVSLKARKMNNEERESCGGKARFLHIHILLLCSFRITFFSNLFYSLKLKQKTS